MGFRAGRGSVTLSITGTAQDIVIPKVKDLSGNGVGGEKFQHSHCRIQNADVLSTGERAHVKFGGVATVSDFDHIIEPGESLVFALPPIAGRVSIIGGGTFVASAEFGIAN